MSPESFRIRIGFLAVLALVAFGVLVARLWYLQVLSSGEYENIAVANTIRELYEPAPRGRIFDRNGNVLVGNRESLVVTVNRFTFENDFEDDEQDSLVLRLATEISRAGRLTKIFEINEALADSRYGPLDLVPIADDVTETFEIVLAERRDEFPGVDIATRSVRNYPYGDLAAHVLGYVSLLSEEQYERVVDAPKNYRRNDEIGQTGIEASFESVLRGTPGLTRLEVDNLGDPIRVLERVEPMAGADVYLTLDVDVQALVEKELLTALVEARKQELEDPNEPGYNAPGGAMVVLNPNGAQLLAMASFPTYSPGEFVRGISEDRWAQLQASDSHQPLHNRGLAGIYPPGSTFKLFTAYAALNSGVIGSRGVLDVRTLYEDKGIYVVPVCEEAVVASCTFRNAGEAVYGEVDLPRALTVSSDVYFYYLADTMDRADRFDREGVQRAAELFGFGAPSGIAIAGEGVGRVPSPSAAEVAGEPWRTGDSIVLGIGQGQLGVTPLQLANGYAAFANGGTLYAPKIVERVENPVSGEVEQSFEDRVLNQIYLPESFSQPILTGLLGAVADLDGTAHTAFLGFPHDEWPVAGKTGTAEVVGKADNSLFAAFGPLPNPTYVVVAIMEESGFGSRVAAPAVRRVIEPIATDSVPSVRTIDDLAELSGRIVEGDDATEAVPTDLEQNR
ncbi:MAG: penicillin-binding protein 2 [Acidimicrobiia bacterium]|nr:penicillin-binding protein 2 [Acidimicrobiia bacterium]MYC58114.1 penicillin-binding protein 2 [Acidimicrobiia bacterium]MYG94396.1 penicillin-binding protein 2 [Acidimicrobiia bacterium]MYI30546.1 penicillin-binding protein 2 [Acidimicrobiia bacterium]